MTEPEESVVEAEQAAEEAGAGEGSEAEGSGADAEPPGAPAEPPAAAPKDEPPAKEKKVKAKPANLVIPPPKPKLSKAERRALQEEQRAAKAAGVKGPQGGPVGAGNKGSPTAAVANTTPTILEDGEQQHPQSQMLKKQASTVSVGTSSNVLGNSHHNVASSSKSTRTLVLTSMIGRSRLVSHLAPYRDPASLKLIPPDPRLHPAVIETGYYYATGQIRGGNARCRAMLQTFAILIRDFLPPSEPKRGNNSTPTSSAKPTTANVDLRHVIDHQVLKPAFQYWTEHCRLHSVSMGNAYTFLKTAVASLDRDIDYATAKEILLETLTAYERERIDFAGAAIAEFGQKLLRNNKHHQQQHHQQQHHHHHHHHHNYHHSRDSKNGDDIDDDEKEVILVYGYSEVIHQLLVASAATANAKKFRVIVVDSRPLLEGRKTLNYLVAAGIDCTYILLNALTYVLHTVTKVLLGASALMSDGSVYGRVGTASVAMAAAAINIPVLICSETYKISNRVQLESITTNELGDPAALTAASLKKKKNGYHKQNEEKKEDSNTAAASAGDSSGYKTLNLLYDLTPASFVSGIVTELGIVPPTSVAVLLREMESTRL